MNRPIGLVKLFLLIAAVAAFVFVAASADRAGADPSFGTDPPSPTGPPGDVLDRLLQCHQALNAEALVERQVGLVGTDQINRGVNDGAIEGHQWVALPTHRRRESRGVNVQSDADATIVPRYCIPQSLDESCHRARSNTVLWRMILYGVGIGKPWLVL